MANPKCLAEATAVLASDAPSAAASDRLIFETPGMVEQEACRPTQSGANRQPSAAVWLTQDAVKLP